MAQLEIYITAEGGNTVSQYYVSKTKHVTFFNEADKAAEIKVKEPVGAKALCEKYNDDTTWKETFTVPAKDAQGNPGSVTMYICKSFGYKPFKYSAQIEGKNIEDPIILVGKDKAGPGPAYNLFDLGLGLLAGIALTLVALRLFRKQRPN